ncbi:c-type cytochrome domain-containing protein, partial [Sphingobacterium sp. IITKGP-BTPF85]|uniref:c-type cytochrome domain-containing protein n=1 Tax=Sphingobacterium sp. IITKGP-BTPF85 TaxID=1338009 RepID=UPI0029347D5E
SLNRASDDLSRRDSTYFTAKCASCHNMEKAKGSLNLTDAASMLKGGKNGKLFVPGNPQISLLLQRLHLPVEDEKECLQKENPNLLPQK